MGHPDYIQPYLGGIAGSVPDCCSKSSHNLVGGRSCLDFVKNSTSVKCNKVKLNKIRYACIKQIADLVIGINKVRR